MRIVFLGTPEFVIPPLKYLVERSNHDVVAVVSQPSKKKGRGQTKNSSPVITFAKENNLKYLEPEKASNPEFLEELATLKPDLCVTCAYGKILTKKFLQIPSRGTINIHPSHLPKYRGATPVPAALLDDLKETSISVLFTVRALDAGNLIVQEPFAIGPTEKSDELLERLFVESIEPLKKALLKLEDLSFEGTPQDEKQKTECSKISKEDGLVNWQSSEKKIYNRFRAFSPWPGTYTFYKGKRLVITDMSLVTEESSVDTTLKNPGQFSYCKTQKSLRIKTESSFVNILKLKPEGKKEIQAQDFWNQVPKSERTQSLLTKEP